MDAYYTGGAMGAYDTLSYALLTNIGGQEGMFIMVMYSVAGTGTAGFDGEATMEASGATSALAMDYSTSGTYGSTLYFQWAKKDQAGFAVGPYTTNVDQVCFTHTGTLGLTGGSEYYDGATRIQLSASDPEAQVCITLP